MSDNFSVWIDADSCPALVRNHVVKISCRLGLHVYFVANKNIPCSEAEKLSDKSLFKMIICGAGKDVADNYIYDNVKEGDLVITRDIVFADRLVQKNICTINDRGTEFTKDIIKERLSTRDFDLQLAQCGLVKHFHEGYDKKKFGQFTNCFDKVIHNLLKN